MIRYVRVLGGSLFIGLLLLLSLSTAAGAASISAPKPNRVPVSPLSNGVLMAQAIHAGHAPIFGHAASTSANPNLTCSPAPCVLPNVQASGGNGAGSVNEVPITANPKNAKQLLTGGNDSNCSSIQGFYATNDGGKTWNHTCLNNLPGSGGCGDPGLGYDLHGTAFITGVDCGSSPWYIAFEQSKDNGKTWSAPKIAVHATFPSGLTDKEWLQVDTTPTSPHANNLYISVTQFDSAGQNNAISVTNSSNGGKTWKTVVVDSQKFPVIDQFSDLAVAKDGTVYVSWMRCPGNGPRSDCGGTKATIYSAKSTDGGMTWSKPVAVGTSNLAPDTCGGYYGCLPNTGARLSDVPPIDVDNSTGKNAGHLYASFYNYTGKFTQVVVATSTDGGKTWGKEVPVAPPSDKHDQFFPWLTVSNAGNVGVTWMDRRNDPQNVKYEAFAAISNNGMTFKKNFQIASKPTTPTGFIGDYTGNIWAGEALYASWPDGRSGSLQDEVGGYLLK